jgi:hypothetical protein
MPEQTQIFFPHKEIVEILARKAGIKEGIWGLYVEFGIAATNIINPEDKSALPAAIVPIVKLGIQRFTEPSSMTIDASKLS